MAFIPELCSVTSSGDLVRIEENTTVAAGATTKKAPKPGKAAALKEKSAEGPEGVVYKARNAYPTSICVT